jgi:hypothetical protein
MLDFLDPSLEMSLATDRFGDHGYRAAMGYPWVFKPSEPTLLQAISHLGDLKGQEKQIVWQGYWDLYNHS